MVRQPSRTARAARIGVLPPSRAGRAVTALRDPAQSDVRASTDEPLARAPETRGHVQPARRLRHHPRPHRRIAERIADVIRAHGHEVELAEVAVERFAHECAELPADRRAAI